MNRQQAEVVARTLESAWPGRALTPEGVALVTSGLADLPYPETERALHRLLRTVDLRPSVARLRRQVITELGWVPPPCDKVLPEVTRHVEAMEQAAFVNGSGWAPEPPPPLSPVARRCLEGLDTTHGSWTAQFRRRYAETAEAYVLALMAGNVNEALAATKTKAALGAS